MWAIFGISETKFDLKVTTSIAYFHIFIARQKKDIGQFDRN